MTPIIMYNLKTSEDNKFAVRKVIDGSHVTYEVLMIMNGSYYAKRFQILEYAEKHFNEEVMRETQRSTKK